MPRHVKIDPAINDGGFTSRSFSENNNKQASISSWIQFYHKPYKLDWPEACKKAYERRNRE